MSIRGSPNESNQMSLAFETRSYDKKVGSGGRIGCTLVTGFLGCGKTTLLQHILDNRGSLQVAVLVNEFGEVDIDSLLLDSTRINSSHGLPAASLAHGYACCSTSGNLKEAVRRALNANYNFDYIVIETSGLANPRIIAKELEDAGVRLDLVVTVVDVETLDTILEIPVAKEQLSLADIVLINKCDLASLGTISTAEDRVEEATGGTKAVRCRFSNVPLDLVLNVTSSVPPQSLAEATANSSAGFLSHEAVTSTFTREVAIKSDEHVGAEKIVQREPNFTQTVSTLQHEHDARVTSVTFVSDMPLSLALFQNFVVNNLQSVVSLLRMKGVVWFEESRSMRHFFHFSGKKRSEAVYAGLWETQPSTEIVLIGRDGVELNLLKNVLSKAVASRGNRLTAIELHFTANSTKEFANLVLSDSRFKFHGFGPKIEDLEGTQITVIFGLVASSLRGVNEGDLNASLMQTVNGHGAIFLSHCSSFKSGGWLQLSFAGKLSPVLAWLEIKTAATAVIAKAFRNVCPCRCDMVPQMSS